MSEAEQAALGARRRRWSCPTPRASATACPPARRRRRPRSSFWTCNHCPYALAWHDRLVEVASEYAERGVRFLAVNSNDSERYPPTGRRRCASGSSASGWPFPYLDDESQEAARAWGAKTTPHLFVLDPEQRIVYEGAPDADHRDPALRARAGCARRSTRSRRSRAAGEHRAGRLLDQVERAEPVTARRRLVRVPASSANLGPGYDVLAAALSLELELEVTETGEFAVDAGDATCPADRSNLCVRAFERLHTADGLRFEIRSEIPLARGLGSSAAAIVAGLVAADHLFELGLERDAIYAHAVELEGHPDNVAAALYGGFVLCPRAEAGELARAGAARAARGGGGGAGDPGRHRADRRGARRRYRAAIPLADAVANVAAATQLVLGIERSDLALIGRGLADRLHQPARRAALRALDGAARAGARARCDRRDDLGAGPSVMLWCFWQDTGKVVEAATAATAGWAEVRRVPFSPLGADVPEL